MEFATASDETIDELEAVVDLMNDRMDQTNLHQKGDEVLIKSGDPLSIDDIKFADYLLSMSKELAVATIQRRIGSLSSLFDLSKNYNPTKEPLVILTFKKIHRKYGAPQKQATPLTYGILVKLKDACSHDIVGLRNKLLLQLGYETM